MAENIGYIKLIQKEPRTWRLFDADGKVLDQGDCVRCTQSAINRDMRISTVH